MLAGYSAGDLARMRARLADEYAIHGALTALATARAGTDPRAATPERTFQVPMPKTLILHLGVHKTATTALQEFLGDNGGALQRAGVAYPRFQRQRSELTPLIASAAPNDQAALGRFVEKVRQPVLLLSDENILGLAGDILGGVLYPYAENRVRRVCDQFADRRIRLFLTLRAPAPFLASIYCEFLRHNPWRPFADYMRGFDVEGFAYAQIFDWLFALPRHVTVTVTPFEAARGGGVRVVAERLLEAACGPGHGIDAGRFPETRSRASYSVEELDLAATIAERADGKTAQIFLNMLDARDRRFGATRFEPLPPATAAALEARYERDLEAFARLSA